MGYLGRSCILDRPSRRLGRLRGVLRCDSGLAQIYCTSDQITCTAEDWHADLIRDSRLAQLYCTSDQTICTPEDWHADQLICTALVRFQIEVKKPDIEFDVWVSLAVKADRRYKGEQ